ncbi:MAG: hypothetical protein IPI48_18515 [bacterium]|nr:hypothetical protein [bacterium]
MFRRLAFVIILAGIGVAAALAAPLPGKVQSVASDTCRGQSARSRSWW